MCSWHTCQTLLFTKAPANYPVPTVPVVSCQGCRGARCTPSSEKRAATQPWNDTAAAQSFKDRTAAAGVVLKGRKTAAAERINPQVGAKSFTPASPPDLPETKLLKGHYCRLPADFRTGTMRVSGPFKAFFSAGFLCVRRVNHC